MKSPINPVTFGVGLVAVVAAIAGVFYIQRGAHVELKGSILKVRTQAMDESSSVMVVDFRFVNTSDYPFVVRQVDVAIEDAAGQRIEGKVVSEVDARRLFEFYPLLGQKFNETLRMRDKAPARQSMDRMVSARFEIAEGKLATRRKLIVRIEDVDGPVSELVQ
ncbi:MAG: hypothetical protein ACRD96_26015 [Bryobacteraceae bacterium]